MTTQEEFERAVAYVGSSNASTSNNVKLELYGYYKIATVSPSPADIGQSRPGIFDFAGRAKYDTWLRLGDSLRFSSSSSDIRAQARLNYIETAKTNLGYDGTHASDTVLEAREVDRKGKKREEDMTADELLDGESDDSQSAGKGMTSVSTMRGEHEAPQWASRSDDSEQSLHDLASSGHLERIRNLNPTAEQCNALDSYGFTPLHLATDRGHTHVVRFLLESGADKSIQDTEGATALDTARILENQDLILILED